MKSGKDFIGVGVGAVILNRKGEVLLMKRKSNIGEDRTTAGMWSVPGGEVNFGERVEDALKREVKEELGVDIEVVAHIGYHDQILKESNVHWHCNSFLCKIKLGKPKILEPDKFDDLGWFPVEKVPGNSGIAHVVAPLHKLGLITKKKFEERVKNTPES